MTYQVGDTVTRESYHHDVVFVIVKIKNETAYLKGVLVRLEADAPLEDLKKYEDENRSSDDLFFEEEEFDKQDFFYLCSGISPGIYQRSSSALPETFYCQEA